MAFVCPPKCETEKRTQLLTDLKNLITSIEDKLVPAAEPTYVITPCIYPCGPCVPCGPCGPCCAPCCPPCQPRNDKQEDECEVPETMICYRVCGKSRVSSKNKSKGNGGEVVNRVKKSTSRELRASILYVGCDCEKRNGLQDDCQRSDCQGQPACLTKPNPTCGPSEYCDGKHLGNKRFANIPGMEQKDTNGDVANDNGDASYVCYPARINPPKCCLPSCILPLDCCPCCPGNEKC